MQKYLNILAGGDALQSEEAEQAMRLLMEGASEPECTAAFLMGLRTRGETLDELVAFAKVMRACAIPVETGDPDAIDLCGTGGDGADTFNISTAAALVCAGAGVTVAKHGNRSVSSQCGSADVLETLGVKTALGKAGVEYCFEKAGIAFLFAPLFHPAMKHVMPVRKKLGVRTFFNILGPLCNPAGVRRQLTGAFDEQTAQTMAAILARLGARRALAVHARDGLDEVSLADETAAFEVREDAESAAGAGPAKRTLRPEDLGFARCDPRALKGGDRHENARIVQEALAGEPGPRRDAVALNASYALWASGKFDSLAACRSAADESIDSGKAQETLRRLAQASHNAPAS